MEIIQGYLFFWLLDLHAGSKIVYPYPEQMCWYIKTLLLPCLLFMHHCISHLRNNACTPCIRPAHMKPCMSHNPSSQGRLWTVLGTLPSWPLPLPTFHARRDLITQKLVQRRIVCFYGISTRAVVNLKPLLQPPLGTVQAMVRECSPLYSLWSWASTLPRTWEPFVNPSQQEYEREGVVNQRKTHSRCSIKDY